MSQKSYLAVWMFRVIAYVYKSRVVDVNYEKHAIFLKEEIILFVGDCFGALLGIRNTAIFLSSGRTILLKTYNCEPLMPEIKQML